MNDNIKLCIGFAISTVIVATAAKSVIQNHHEEHLKRQEIERNLQLDIQAIKNSTAVMNKRIEQGHIHSVNELIASVNNEIAFQKIAIREDN